MILKQCKICGEFKEKSKENFYFNLRRNSKGVHYYCVPNCKTCFVDIYKERHRKILSNRRKNEMHGKLYLNRGSIQYYENEDEMTYTPPKGYQLKGDELLMFKNFFNGQRNSLHQMVTQIQA